MTVTADRFDSDLRVGARVAIATPEAVPLVFAIASVGERLVALVYDMFLVGMLAGLAFLLGLAMGPAGITFGLAAQLALRNLWFLGFELRMQGRTPGKRRCHLRVIDALGRPLAPLSVVVRNLTREIELTLPLMALSDPEQLVGAGPGWLRVFAALWTAAFLAVPLIDRRHRRVGDLLAGTVVVRDPRPVLLADLAEQRPPPAEDATAGALTFTLQQLDVYGIYELQVLEQVLRDERESSPAIQEVAARIARKIGWQQPLSASGGSRAFLHAFYRAQRARLEHQLALGRARQRKRGARRDGDA